MTADRNDPGYEPRFDLDYEFGRQGELWVDSVVQALRTERAEVKTDGRVSRTGNLYVEFECRRRDGWQRSGLATTQSDVWVFVLGSSGMALVVKTDVLKELCRPLWKAGKVAAETDGSHPTKGVLLPLNLLVAYVRERRVA